MWPSGKATDLYFAKMFKLLKFLLNIFHDQFLRDFGLLMAQKFTPWRTRFVCQVREARGCVTAPKSSTTCVDLLIKYRSNTKIFHISKYFHL